MKIVKEKQDLTFLNWSHARTSSGTAGTFLKSQSTIGGEKKYYKLSNFDSARGVVGHECVNEIIVDRLLSILEVPHLDYELLNAEIEIEGKRFNTYLCSSVDFKSRGESKASIDDYYRINMNKGESRYDFCVRQGWKKYIDEMIAIDFLILNRDRHGANIEVLRNSRTHSLRIAPLFDHGLSLIYPCTDAEAVKVYDILEDKRCNNFIGTQSCFENLSMIKDCKPSFEGKLRSNDKEFLFEGMGGILPQVYIDTIWNMIWERYQIYEKL